MRAIDRILPEVANHPLHRYLGVEKIEVRDGRSRVELTVGDGTVNPRGIFHGGVAYLLCDMACYSVLLGELADNEDAVTHDIHVSVLRAARHGDRVVASGRVIKRGRNIAFMEAELYSGDQMIARGTVTKSILQNKTAE